MSHAASDRNLLFGILALQMDFIRRDDLIGAMNAWVLDKARPLGQILCERGYLADERHALLDALVQAHLKQHGDDPQRSLAAVSAPRPLRDELKEIADPDVQSTLSSVSSATPLSNGAAPPPGGPSRYRRLRLHAHGGLGDVYLAEDTELHREVALKEIRAHRADDAESRSRFIVEAEVTGGLEHPGVVPVYGLGTYPDGRPYYAMRFIRGESLKAAIEQFHADDKQNASERRLAFRHLLRRFVDACNAIAYAHSRGVLHRDLKPANIMLGKFGETLVVDWGLAKAGVRRSSSPHAVEATTDPTFHPGSGSDQHATQAGLALGTPTYMSPEQAAGKVEELGPASDVYGLGATLYVLLTGHRPFRGETPDEVLGQVRSGKLAPPREVRPDVPPSLDAVCRKAMAFRPAERYASPLELAADIEHWLADEPVSVYAEPWPARAGRWARRHRTAVVAACVLLATALVALSTSTALIWREQRKTAAQERLAERNYANARDLSYSGFDLVARAEPLFAAKPNLSSSRKTYMVTSARVFRELLDQQPDDPQLQRQTAGVYRYTANMHRFKSELQAAEPLYRDGIALLERLVKESPADTASRKALAEMVRDFGPMLGRLGHLREAAATLDRALGLSRELAKEEPTVSGHRRNLATSLVDLCNVEYSLGQLEDCGAHAAQAVARFVELQELPPPQHPYNPLLLAAAHNWVGIVARDAGRLEEATAAHREACRILQQPLPPAVAKPTAAHFLAVCRLDLAKTLSQVPAQRAAAAEELDRALAACQKLHDADANAAGYRQSLARAYQERGRARLKDRQLTAARADYERSRDLLEDAVRDSPDVPELRGDLGRAYAGLAQVARRARDGAAADSARAQAEAALEQAIRNSPDNVLDRRSVTELRTAGQ